MQELARMRTAIMLLALSACASVLGTLVPQGLALENYVSRYGADWAQILWFSGLTDVFRAWWYLGVWLVLLMSVLTCLVRNGPKIFQQVWMPRRVPKAGDHGCVQGEAPSRAALRTAGLNYAGEVKNYVVWQGGVLNRLGYFAIHVGVVGVAMAGLLSGLLGWRGTMNIREGEADHIVLIGQGRQIAEQRLPFRLRNEYFHLDYYRSGSVRSYVSHLNATNENGEVHAQVQVSVNAPAHIGPWYGGYRVYQASYGDAGSCVEGMVVSVLGGWHAPLKACVYKQTRLPDGTRIDLLEARSDTQVTLAGQVQNAGPSVDYRMLPPAGEARQLRAFKNYPDLIGVAEAPNSEGVVQYRPVWLGLALTEESAPLWAVAGRLARLPEAQTAAAFKAEMKPVLMGLPDSQRVSVSQQVLQAVQVLCGLGVTALVQPEGIDLRRYSGLQIVYDPGVWVFWISALVLALGVVLMLGRRLVRVWVAGDGTHALVSSPHGARVVQEMVERLQEK